MVALEALRYAMSTNSGKIDIVAYSGGAGAFTAAYGVLSSSEQQRIGNILYVSPGANGSLVTNDTTSIVRGSGPVDVGAMIGTGCPRGTPVEQVACGHTDVACLSNASTAIVLSTLWKQMILVLRKGHSHLAGFGTFHLAMARQPLRSATVVGLLVRVEGHRW